jgi:UDP-4-amino-4,6-dideoxy-N-acetyl-beta-L-altrosamine transaminase
MMKPIPYGRQHITQEDIEAVTRTLQSDFLTQGPAIGQFEKEFGAYVGAEYAVAVSNGTAALHLAAMAVGVKEGDKVITSPITFAASANCVRYCGGEVVFADIDPNTALLDLDKVAALLKAAPKGTYSGIIPVDFAGLPVDGRKFRELADEYGLWIIQDACHSPGGYFLDQKNQKHFSGSGEFADLTVFSFHPVKHIASGEGGMITTNNKELYGRLLLLRTHGITKNEALLEKNDGGWYYEMQELGFNYRLTDFQAALGSSQLKRADRGLERRREIAQKYDLAFMGTPIDISIGGYKEGHAYHLYVVKLKDRLGAYNHLKDNNIFAQVHYIPLHLMPYYKKFGYKAGDFPAAEAYYEACLSLPMYPTLTDEEQAFVISKLRDFTGV